MLTSHQQRRIAALQFKQATGGHGERLSLTHPQFNLREIAKQMVLLEDHLSQSYKHCPDCIRKHLLTIEAFAEEAVGLDTVGVYRETGERIAEVAREWLEQFHDRRPLADIGQEVRRVRKMLVSMVADPREAVVRVASRHMAATGLCLHQRVGNRAASAMIDRYKKILLDHKIPLPSGQLIDLQYNMGRADWYARTPAGWFWWDPRQGGSWKPAPLGPM